MNSTASFPVPAPTLSDVGKAKATRGQGLSPTSDEPWLRPPGGWLSPSRTAPHSSSTLLRPDAPFLLTPLSPNHAESHFTQKPSTGTSLRTTSPNPGTCLYRCCGSAVTKEKCLIKDTLPTHIRPGDAPQRSPGNSTENHHFSTSDTGTNWASTCAKNKQTINKN